LGVARTPRPVLALLAAGALAGAGCGSSKPSTAGTTAAAGSSGALSADATSAATGDIPDNQVFLVFHDPAAGYSIKYPEGWTQRGSGRDVTFKDKNNLVQIAVSGGGAPTTASVATALAALRASNPTLSFKPPQVVRIGPARAVTTTYTTRSAPNPVTGKRVLLVVDRYELASNGRRAVVDLGTPQGVDNVDAYRAMIESFHWQ
jgi:PsbP